MQIDLKSIFKRLLSLLALSFLLLLSSCDIQKAATKSKTDFTYKDDFEKHSFRKGDSVSYRPNSMAGIVYKDTTIYRVTKNNTRLETVYDSNGNIRDINCYTDKIEELTRRNLELEIISKEKESTKTENFDSTFIFYIIAGVTVLGMFGQLLLFLYIKQNSNTINTILQNISK